MNYICDFCSAPAVTWSYPARNFVGFEGYGVVSESVGGWAACEACHALIESGNRSGLTDRSVSMLLANQAELIPARDEIALELADLHAKFFHHRVGNPIPLRLP